jgi:hypothetical protein
MGVPRKFVTGAALAVASFALMTAGASATFTDKLSPAQQVTAGTTGLRITDGAGGVVSADGKSVTLPVLGPVSSTFESTHRVITLTNTGDIDLTAVAFQLSETHAGAANNNALASQLNVCVQSADKSGGPRTEGNGPLWAAVNLVPTLARNPLVMSHNPGGVNHSMTFSVDVYAGKDSTQCNPVHSDGLHTNAAWNALVGHGYSTPASLTNAAIGGVVTPKLTFSFTG